MELTDVNIDRNFSYHDLSCNLKYVNILFLLLNIGMVTFFWYYNYLCMICLSGFLPWTEISSHLFNRLH